MAADWLHRLHIWLNDNQGIGIWVTAGATVLLAVGIVFTYRSVVTARAAARAAIDDAKTTRHAQLVLALDARWIDPAIRSAGKLYDSYTKQGLADLVEAIFDPAKRATTKPTSKQEADYWALASFADLIETIGALCADGAITEDVVYNVWGGPIADIWRAWELALPRLRALWGEDDIFKNFDDLGKAMAARLPKATKK